MKQGECTYVDKVRMAQRYGAIAIIVGRFAPWHLILKPKTKNGNHHIILCLSNFTWDSASNSPSNGLVTMHANENASDVVIPAVFVNYDTHNILSEEANEFYPLFPMYQVRVTR